MPGDYLGWMVKVDDSWPPQQNSAWKSPNLNFMNTLLKTSGEKSGLQSRMNPSNFSLNEASPEFVASGLPGLRAGQTNDAYGFLPNLPSHLESSLSTPYPNLKEKQSASSYELGVQGTPNIVSGPTHKRFLIFDRSGDQTRLFLVPICPNGQNPSITPTLPIHACNFHDEKWAENIERKSPIRPIIQDLSDDNNNYEHEGSEIREDTEEINALLYSDDDDYYDDDDEDDDEVTSTDQSPLVNKGIYEKLELDEEIMEEVASSDGPTKRQRLSDGGYKKSSFVDIVSSVKLNRIYENDAESSCVKVSTREANVGSFLCPRKDKIRETLKILEGIVPGVKSKDPLLVIDEAINYLKFLQLKAKALGVDYY